MGPSHTYNNAIILCLYMTDLADHVACLFQRRQCLLRLVLEPKVVVIAATVIVCRLIHRDVSTVNAARKRSQIF